MKTGLGIRTILKCLLFCFWFKMLEIILILSGLAWFSCFYRIRLMQKLAANCWFYATWSQLQIAALNLPSMLYTVLIKTGCWDSSFLKAASVAEPCNDIVTQVSEIYCFQILFNFLSLELKVEKKHWGKKVKTRLSFFKIHRIF